MTRSKRTAKAKGDPKALTVSRLSTETPEAALAHTSLRPTVQAALTLLEYNKPFGELSLNTLVDDLSQQCKTASGGDLQRAEAILTAQAHTLDAIFNNVARQAARNMGEYLNAAETYLRLALKAQSQCCRTLETLALIKNPPPTTFVHQANIANNQQVNNGAEPSRARAAENLLNKLLEETDGERLDTSTTQATVEAGSTLEAVGAVDGPANTSR